MPRILFIRVSASTYDEKDVPRTWPMLYAAVWPDKDLEGVDSPKKLARKLAPAREKGALELAEAFAEHARFGDMDAKARQALKDSAGRLEDIRKDLDAALGDRDVKKAEALCSALENALDDAESAMRGL